jgi:hypothetical protein
MADERDRLSRLSKLEADAKALAAEQAKSKSANAEKVKAAKKESELARAEQLKTQREARELAARLGAKVDTATGLIDPKTVTTPFGVYGSKAEKTVTFRGYRGSGANRVYVVKYVDGTEDVTSAPELTGGGGGGGGGGKKVVSTYTDEETGDVIAVYSDGSKEIISKGNRIATSALAAQQAAAAEAESKRKAGQSAYTLLFEQFNQYGLGGLVEPLKGFIQDGLSEAEFTLRLRDTDAYRKRFAANQTRISKGLRAISEAEYIRLEDQYQETMRRYGMPETYYKRGDMGRQEGFEKFIGSDVSPVELEDRIQTAYNRVINANPEVAQSLRAFYPDVTDGDILAYALDPDKAIENIKRKVTAAEIGSGATRAGLATGVSRAEELARAGVTKEQAASGFGTIASGLERGRQLSQIYNQPDYTQAVAEAEVFALPDAEQARRQRRKLGQLETAEFGGTTGMTGGALSRERAGQY